MKLKYVTSLIISVSFLGQQQALAQMQPPAQPVYETCQQVEVQVGDSTQMQTDQQCLSRNSIKSRDYNAAVEAYNRGTQIISSDSKSITEPTKPTYENCLIVGGDNSNGNNYDHSCNARNQSKEREYNLQMSGYNEAKSQEAKAKAEAQTAEQARLAQLAQQKSAQQAMKEAEEKNKKGSAIYQMASMACGVASAVYAAKFAASCGYRGCSDMPSLYKSIAFAIFSGMASKQASSHDSVANNACQAANKMSSSPTDCGAAPSTPAPDSFPTRQVTGITTIFDKDGKCISTPEKCAGIISTLPPGVNIRDAMKGVTSFASGKVPFKVNKDGSITDKNGKKFTAANFASEKDMIAAGLSPSEAKSLMGDLNKANMSSALSNAKADLDKENAQDFGTLVDISGPGGGAKGAGVTNNGNAKGSSDTDGGKREPASAEGLAKDFNGELIGVAGDDIFKMMNRRYKLKTAQDSFIGP